MARYKKILVHVDLSQDSEQIAVAARDLAADSQASLVALHVVEYLPIEPLGESVLPTPQVGDELLDQSRAGLEALIGRLALLRASIRVVAGNTKAEILRVADEESADLIVIGSRERHGLGILVNFTEDTVLHAAHCDVLTVRLK